MVIFEVMGTGEYMTFKGNQFVGAAKRTGGNPLWLFISKGTRV